MIDEILKMRTLIPRPLYTEKIKPFIDKEIIKVISGQRQAGKSHILFLLIKDIHNANPSANIIYISKEFSPRQSIADDDAFYRYVKELLKPGEKNYLFVDEIQEIKDFEKTLRILQSEKCCDIFCSRNNACVLADELAKYRNGYMEFPVHTLGYEEFMRFQSLENSTLTLNKYLSIGGLPYMHTIGTKEFAAFEYLRNVYPAILLKDIMARVKIRNVQSLENLVEFLADNVGNFFLTHSLTRYLKSQQASVPAQVVRTYLKPLANAYFIHKAPHYDVSGMNAGEKYYFEDLGLCNCIHRFDLRENIRKIMENAVFLHLLHLGYKIYAGQQSAGEVDFVAEKDGKTIYLQISGTQHDGPIRQHAFGNLLKINSNYPRYAVTMNKYNTNGQGGISLLHLKDFLLKQTL